MRDPYEIVRRPIVTEKSMDGVAEGKYTFEVAPDSNKIEIGQAIAKLFKVNVVKVNTITVKGKKKRVGRHPEGKTPDIKKAIVTVAPGERIKEIVDSM